MNLLLLAHRVPYPADKGEKIRTFNNLAYLVAKGHKVTVVTPLENKQDLTFANKLSEHLDVKVAHAQLSNRHLRKVHGFLSRQALSVTNFHNPTLQDKLESLITTEQPDAIMCTSSAMAKYVFQPKASELIKKQNIRLVMDFMDLDSLKWNQYATRKPWPLSMVYEREAKLLSVLESKILNRFDASLFVSAEEKELLKNNPDLNAELNAKVHVVTNGVDRDAYYPGNSNSEKTLFANASPVILFTGVMDYFPNEDAVNWFATSVWPSIIEKHPNARFVIAGMRPSRKVKELENHSGIEVTGYLDDILPYYQQADFLVAPFRVARGIQNKVMQAMACGLPVISSPEGAAGIKFVNNEHLTVAETPEAYLATIDTLMNDKEQYQRISRGGLDLVATQYSWERENAKLERILDGQPHEAPVATGSGVGTLSPA